MQVYLLIAAGGILAIGYACYLVVLTLLKVSEGITDGVKAIGARKGERRARLDQEKALALHRAEQANIEAYRSQNPVRIVGIPNLDAYKRVFTILDEFTAAANSFRPQFSGAFDGRFKTQFPSHLFAFERPDPDSLPQTEPVKITITADELAMSGGGLNMLKLYESANMPCTFPYEPPHYQLDVTAAPVFPNIAKPPRRDVKLLSLDNTEVDASSEYLRRAHESELNKVATLNNQAIALFEEFDRKYSRAVEAFDVMNLYLANLKLKLKDAHAAISAQYAQFKSAFERDCEQATRPLRRTFKLYNDRTPQGIKQHFVFALSTLALPLPSNYQWDVFYDENERLLQVNQCVPSLSDIKVLRRQLTP